MSRNLSIIIWSMLMPLSLHAQAKLGIENYYYPGIQGASSVVPIVHFETGKSWRGELRYNYEDAKTLSFFAGKTIATGNALECSITPMLGLSTGTFSGFSLATNIDVEWKSLYLSSQNQYSLSAKKNYDHFFFSWSELGYNFSDHFFGGIAVQFTRTGGNGNAEPGFVGGFCIGNLTVPFYVFSPFSSGRYYIAGLIYECDFKRQKK
jgi:hypothetical protein